MPKQRGQLGPLVGLAIVVLAILGAVKVISTDAHVESDPVAGAATQLDAPVVTTDGVVVETLKSESATTQQSLQSQILSAESVPQVLTESLSKQEAITGPQPSPVANLESIPVRDAEPTPSPTPEPEAAPDSLCVPAADGSPYCTYTVQSGDTLWGIAGTLDLSGTASFSSAELLALNNGLNDAQNWLITPGEELIVPDAPGVVHTVTEGESVSELAENFGVSLADLIDANAISDPNSVVVGDTILIPSPSLWPLSGPAADAQPYTPADGEAPADSTDVTATDQPAEESPTDAPEAVVEDTPTPEPEATAASAASLAPSSSTTANPSVSEIRDLFAAGYIDAVGPPQYLDHLLTSVIACESGYNLRAYNPAGPFYGLMQFLPETWARMGGGDWFDPYQQGHNAGVLLRSAYPQTQWPVCWG